MQLNKRIRREDRLLYLCCTQDLSPARLDCILVEGWAPDLNWRDIFSLAHEHGIAPLVYQNLQAANLAGLKIPTEIEHQFRLATYQNVLAKQKSADIFANALAYLNENGYEAMAVKGTALDLLVYDYSWYTLAGDIDVVLRKNSSERMLLPWQQIQKALNGLHIEYELNTHHDITLNQTLPIDFARIWQDAMVVDYHDSPLYLMAPEDMLLAVCINSCRKRYFRLRSLCDIAETVKRFPQIDWTLFAQKAITYGCNNIAYTALSVADATVTLLMPGSILDCLAVGALRRSTINNAIRYLVENVPLSSLSYYTGSKVVGRKVGWSLLLPYLTYNWQQMGSKVQEAVTSYMASSSRSTYIQHHGEIGNERFKRDSTRV